LDAMRNLLQLPTATYLLLTMDIDQWCAVVDEIRCGHCHVQDLGLVMRQAAATSEVIQAAASAISAIQQLDYGPSSNGNLEHLTLGVEGGFTDETGVALAQALTVNQTLRTIALTEATNFGVPAYVALSAMLRVNTSLVLELPPLENADADEKLRESRDQLRMEDRLNQVGRGRLLSSHLTTRDEWVDALHELSSNTLDNSPSFQVSCLYSLLRSNPSVV
jgi:hypothetical protein